MVKHHPLDRIVGGAGMLGSSRCRSVELVAYRQMSVRGRVWMRKTQECWRMTQECMFCSPKTLLLLQGGPTAAASFERRGMIVPAPL